MDMLSADQKDEEATRIAAGLWNLGMAHSDHKLYGDYKKLWDRINSQDEKFAVTCLLKLSLIIDSYTFQNPSNNSSSNR